MRKIESPILEVSNVSKKNKSASIENMTFSLNRGDCFVVLHKSAKSAELAAGIISGKITPNKGKIFFKSEDVTGQRAVFGTVGRKLSISKRKTVCENAVTAPVKKGLVRAMAAVLVRKELPSFELEQYADTPVSSLSPSQALRTELFSAYMCSHELMLVEEPYSDFEENVRADELKWLSEIAGKNGLALLIFTENIDTAIALGNTVMIADSKMKAVGTIGVDRNNLEKSRAKIEEYLTA